MDKWHSIKDLCKLLSVSRPTIMRLIKENRLKAINVGGKKRPTWKVHDISYQRFVAESLEYKEINGEIETISF